MTIASAALAELNNRELAILFWLAVFVAWAATKFDIRTGFFAAARSFAEPKIVAPLVVMAGWVGLEVWLGSRLGIWTERMVKDTAIWFVTSGVVLLFNFDDASKDPDFFRKKTIAALLPVALLGVLLDIFVLPLIAELLLLPILAILGMLAVASKIEERYRPVERVAMRLLGVIALLFIAHAAFELITQWGHLDRTHLLLEVFLPAWLAIGLLPFVYAFALYAAYELAFLRLNWGSTAGKLPRVRTEVALLVGLHVDAHAVGSFAGPWPYRLASASSFNEAFDIVKDFRRTLRRVDGSTKENA